MHTTNRRDRKRAATHRAIRLAALRLAVDHGAERVTVADITEAADVSRGTFFHHFSGKDAVFTPDPPWTPNEMHARLLDRPAAESPLDSFREVLSEAVDALESDRELSALWPRFFARHPEMTPAHQPALVRAMAEAIAQRLGDAADDLYPVLLAETVTTAFLTARRHAAATGTSLPDALTRTFDMLDAGLRPAEPR